MDAIIAIVAAIVGIGVGVGGGYVLRNAALSRGIDAAKGSAAGLIAEAESEKKHVLLAAQEEALQTRQAAEGELRDRRKELQRSEDRFAGREEAFEKRQGAVEAREQLEAAGTPTRVVSIPSWYLFGQQDQSYRDEVLPPDVTNRVSIEAGSTFGWERWVGSVGRSVGLDHFGASAPAEVLYEKFGITVESVVEAVRSGAPS